MTAAVSLVPATLDSTVSRPQSPSAMALHPAGSGRVSVELIDIAVGLATTARHIPVDDGDDTRRYARVLSTPLYEAWVIRWSASAALTLHDHGGSSGAVVVVDGELVEVRIANPPWRASRSRTLHRGDVLAINPDTVHSISNEQTSDALSVHVYSPPLSTMTFYDELDGQLTRTKTSRPASTQPPLLP